MTMVPVKSSIDDMASANELIGKRIRGYDFEPIEGREPIYIEGVVLDVVIPRGYYAYMIKVDNDSGVTEGDRVGEVMLVPVETSHDYEGRVMVDVEIQ